MHSPLNAIILNEIDGIIHRFLLQFLTIMASSSDGETNSKLAVQTSSAGVQNLSLSRSHCTQSTNAYVNIYLHWDAFATETSLKLPHNFASEAKR